MKTFLILTLALISSMSLAQTRTMKLDADCVRIQDGICIDKTEFGYLENATANIQYQLNNLDGDIGNASADLATHAADTTTHGTTGNIVGTSDSQTLTNKTIDADANTITNIENADIKAAAAIDATKIANGNVSNSEFQALDGSIDLASEVTGVAPVANGGTGQSSLTANSVILGNGTSGVAFVAPSTSGNVLTSNGTTWVSSALGSIAVTSVSTTYTALSSDYLLLASASGGAYEIALPTAVGITGKIYNLLKTTSDFTAVTINPNGTETIGGTSTTTLDTLNESLLIVSDGSNWQILSRVIPSNRTTYSPTLVGFGSGGTAPTSVDFEYWREGRHLVVTGKFTAGTVTATEARLPFPANVPNSTAFTSTIRVAGHLTNSISGASSSNNFSMLIKPSVSYFNFNRHNSSGGNAASLGNEFNNSEVMTVYARAPITGWND